MRALKRGALRALRPLALRTLAFSLLALSLVALNLLACGPLAHSGPTPSAAAPSVTRHALLVGVDGAPSAPGRGAGALTPLRGAVRDAQALAARLVGRFRFAPERVQVLADPDGPVLRAALAGLVAAAGAGDEVLFHFSGHGLRVLDRDGDELDGFDEALLLADGTTLLDDELGRWLRDLAARGALATVLIDACHSGTAVRDASPWRGLPLDAAGEGAALDRSPTDSVDGEPDRPAALGVLGDYVFLAAATAGQRAHEVHTPEGHHGAFTWHLLQALDGLAPGTTWRGLAAQVKAGVQSLAPGQAPQLEGPRADRAVFGSALGPRGHRVRPGADGTVEVLAGGLLGLEPGLRLRPVGPDPAAAQAGTTGPHLRVVSAGALTSVAEWVDLAGAPPPLADLLVRPETRALTPFRLAVAVPEAPPPALAAALDLHPGLVPQAEGGLLRLAVEGDAVRLLAADGGLRAGPAALADAAALARLLGVADDWARWWAVQSLPDGAADGLQLDLDLGETGAASSAGPHRAPAGTRAVLSIKNTSETRLYLHLFALDDTGSVALLHPPPGAVEHLEAGETWSQAVRLSVSPGAATADDWLVLVGTAVPSDLSALAGEAAPTRSHAPTEAPLTAWSRASAWGTRTGPVRFEADAVVVRRVHVRVVGPAGPGASSAP